MLALAHRKLPGDTTAAAVRGMPREEAESQLQLAGFAVLQCPLKPESEPALAALAGETLPVQTDHVAATPRRWGQHGTGDGAGVVAPQA